MITKKIFYVLSLLSFLLPTLHAADTYTGPKFKLNKSGTKRIKPKTQANRWENDANDSQFTVEGNSMVEGSRGPSSSERQQAKKARRPRHPSSADPIDYQVNEPSRNPKSEDRQDKIKNKVKPWHFSTDRRKDF